MSFITDGVSDAVALTLHKIQRNEDESASPIVPEVDRKQQAEALAEARDGRTDEMYRQCLEYHGFRFVPAHQLPPLQGRGFRTEGEWRHTNPRVKLAFTSQDLASGFRSGEDLDKFLRDQKMAAAVTRGRVAKEALVQSRRRR